MSTPGPGSYNTLSDVNRSIMNPTIPRTGAVMKKYMSRNISATIKADFETEEQDEDSNSSPGPGSYRAEVSSFKVNKVRPNSLQIFGSNSSRFLNLTKGNVLGPGQYKQSNGIGLKYNSAIQMAGQAAFRSPTRPEPISAQHFEIPGPGEYTSQTSLFLNVKGSQKQALGGVSKRFDRSDTLAPGPGQYIKAEVEVGVKHKPGKKTLKILEGPQHLVIPSVVNKPGL